LTTIDWLCYLSPEEIVYIDEEIVTPDNSQTFDASKSTAQYSKELVAIDHYRNAGLKLLVSPDTTQEKRYIELGLKQIVFGRDPQDGAYNIVIRDNFLSRNHIKVHFDNATHSHCIEDLDTTNGTSLNGLEISSAELKQGDLIRIGETILLYTQDPGHELNPQSLILGQSYHIGNLQTECKNIIEFNRAGGDLPVLVLGETGVGKTYIARELHRLSKRRGRFISVNCAGLPASIIESSLFGHIKGAFTGASRDRKGFFEDARGGTLFLDEVGELPIELQSKFLKVIDEKTVTRLGSSRENPVDLLIICATNRNL